MSACPPDEPDAPCLRVDAQRNRERLVTAAREVFAENGVDASLEAVARRAGVGVATLYRRFPTRPDLIACVFQEKMADYAEAISDALATDDPWVGFCDFVERVCAMQAADRGFTDVLTTTFPSQPQFEQERARAYRGFVDLVERAQAAGSLRPDFVTQDLVLVLMANAGVVEGTADAAPDAWRRLVAYLVQAFAAPEGRLPDPPVPRAMEAAMLRSRPPTG